MNDRQIEQKHNREENLQTFGKKSVYFLIVFGVYFSVYLALFVITKVINYFFEMPPFIYEILYIFYFILDGFITKRIVQSDRITNFVLYDLDY